ncbi:hypothetical protein LEMA_P005930.1 [Plenodomus lingam JN3]|uniref:Xylanolytic transcriptional activator regulatory domain-containing protein n=1 Tax=Leptosphaeria maculans (strain JN3 / isolate v23.1.3 / race Av1-4-5-6-7-8) TaxID=985895 RepID=E5AF17_LEPMJ|nr:hypothetical protein LEMA_P005930.1 [Plenodomus lingam JN3]CBY01806.1 hypothetical protein LEMA_P005930.1 [Plenodomus lingam JN3]
MDPAAMQATATSSTSSDVPIQRQRPAAQKSACLGCRDTKQKCSRGRPWCKVRGVAPKGCHANIQSCPSGGENREVQRHHRVDEIQQEESLLHAAIQDEASHEPPSVEPSNTSYHEEPINAVHDRIYAPLQIVAATVDCSDVTQWPHTIGSGMEATNQRSDFSSRGRVPHAGGFSKFRGRNRFSSYFQTSVAICSDWEELASQAPEGTLQIRPSIHDPLASRLLDDNDVAHAFELFFRLRNPFVGLLDPALHTPQYVYSASFTLFSVICALGCALSTEPRNRLLYPTLTAVADANIRWSMAMSVKSVETVQALLLFAYWGPAHEKQRDDPYWLRLSHAIQLARELDIGRSQVVQERATLYEAMSQELRERFMRNMERTWLYVFIADKSFGITTGRAMCFSWKEIPSDASTWWQKPSAAPHDRMICGIVEMRVTVVKALECRKHGNKDRIEITRWQRDAFKTLSNIRKQRCEGHECSPTLALPVLAFYIDYALLLVNTHAAGDLISLGLDEILPDVSSISQQSADIAMRLIDLILSNLTLVELKSGFHNCQLVMMCHAVTEILNTVRRGARPDLIQTASVKVRALSNHLQNVASTLPISSWAQIYADIAQVLVQKLDTMAAKHLETFPENGWVNFVPDDTLCTDWWSSVGGGHTDLMDWVDLEGIGGMEDAMV